MSIMTGILSYDGNTSVAVFQEQPAPVLAKRKGNVIFVHNSSYSEYTRRFCPAPRRRGTSSSHISQLRL